MSLAWSPAVEFVVVAAVAVTAAAVVVAVAGVVVAAEGWPQGVGAPVTVLASSYQGWQVAGRRFLPEDPSPVVPPWNRPQSDPGHLVLDQPLDGAFSLQLPSVGSS